MPDRLQRSFARLDSVSDGIRTCICTTDATQTWTMIVVPTGGAFCARPLPSRGSRDNAKSGRPTSDTRASD